jgi:hypothetical protein
MTSRKAIYSSKTIIKDWSKYELLKNSLVIYIYQVQKTDLLWHYNPQGACTESVIGAKKDWNSTLITQKKNWKKREMCLKKIKNAAGLEINWNLKGRESQILQFDI